MCLQVITGFFTQHFLTECLQKSSILKVSEKVAIFADQTCICARCLNLFKKDKWEYHQKKIRKHCLGFRESNIKLSTPAKSVTDHEFPNS